MDTETKGSNVKKHREDGQKAQERGLGQIAPCSLGREQLLQFPASRTERDLVSGDEVPWPVALCYDSLSKLRHIQNKTGEINILYLTYPSPTTNLRPRM